MIEVEKKFNLTPEQEKALIEGASLVSNKTFTDTYFDNKEYFWTTKDTWLRSRDGRFELKVPLNSDILGRISDQYEELEDDKEIADFMELPNNRPLKEVLSENGLKQFCSITTKRKKYKKEKFVIDIDEMDFGYRICEIELLVNNVSEIKNAEDEIIAFASRFNLGMDRVRGKVLEYLKINNPQHMVAIESRSKVK